MPRAPIYAKIVLTCVISFWIFFYMPCIYHIDTNELGVEWNPIKGELRADSVPGYYVSAPWERVSKIDLRPQRVTISTTANCLNYKLVAFDRRYWREFVNTQGFGYWWWNNRLSFNAGYGEESRGFKDVMRGYAYSRSRYKFVILLKEE